MTENITAIMNDIGLKLKRSGLECSEPFSSKEMEVYLSEVLKWSNRFHLIGRGNLIDNIERQVISSALLLYYTVRIGVIEDGCRVADIGSGAGFPGIVWKILNPEINITLFERKEKPQLFLERMSKKLFTGGVKVEGKELKGHYDHAFDVVVSKAAGVLKTLLPLAEGILEIGGVYVTIKGGGWKREIEEAACRNMELVDSEALSHGLGEVLAFRKSAYWREEV